ncbi:MAG: hypothetical protein ACRES9_02225, partial [Gammaproteobacteria bacterium]
LYIVQDEYNAEGPSPLGSCGEDPVGGEPDPACPWLNDESYYICPKNGCIIYTIAMNDSNYQPGTTPSPAELPPAYLPPAPATQNRNQLVKYGTSNVVVPELKFDNAKPPEPYYVPAGGQSCKSTQPPQTQPPQ